jgi:hypothetical protein
MSWIAPVYRPLSAHGQATGQLEIRRALLDENREQQDGLVEALTHLKQDSANARVTQQLDTLAAEEARIRASIAQLEQKDAVLVASQTVLPDTPPAKAGRFSLSASYLWPVSGTLLRWGGDT